MINLYHFHFLSLKYTKHYVLPERKNYLVFNTQMWQYTFHMIMDRAHFRIVSRLLSFGIFLTLSVQDLIPNKIRQHFFAATFFEATRLKIELKSSVLIRPGACQSHIFAIEDILLGIIANCNLYIREIWPNWTYRLNSQ